jgi:hypothetical protein
LDTSVEKKETMAGARSGLTRGYGFVDNIQGKQTLETSLTWSDRIVFEFS